MAMINKIRLYDSGTESVTDADLGATSNNILMSDNNSETLDDKLASLNQAIQNASIFWEFEEAPEETTP